MFSPDSIHPAVTHLIRHIDHEIEHPTDLFLQFPELHLALAVQRDFIARRPQIPAHNFESGAKTVIGLMRVEGGETLEAIWKAVKAGQRVDGTASAEGADDIIFAAQCVAIASLNDKRIRGAERAEVVLNLVALNLLSKIFPHFDHKAPLEAKVAKNESNWPVVPLGAPSTWDIATIAHYHRDTMRPMIKALRRTMPGETRVMHQSVTEALNAVIPEPPQLDGALPDYPFQYMAIINEIQTRLM